MKRTITMLAVVVMAAMVSGCATKRAQVGPVVVGDAQGQPAPGFAVRLGQTATEHPIATSLTALAVGAAGYFAHDQGWFTGSSKDKPEAEKMPTYSTGDIRAEGGAVVIVGPGVSNGDQTRTQTAVP
jgi:hypothetical protein